jgi:hypothetical protein
MNRRVLASTVALLTVFLTGCPHETPPATGYGEWKQDSALVDELKKRETGTNGIEVGAPKFYDDASLKALLDQTRARLSTINGFNESALVSHLGAITGSTVDQTQFGVQVLGPLPPSVATTANGPTTQTTTNAGLPAGQTTLPTSSTVTTNPSQSTVTTSNPATPSSILPTIPSGLTYTPPTSMAGSALDVLNEEMQLNNDIAGYQLLLEGAISDRFVQNQNLIKPRTTIGFPISISPQSRYENAVAVIEVEVQNADKALSNEPPTITTILPTEKTYNVAALTDSTKSIGAGVVVHAISIGGSWFGAHRTYYVVQDQDTVALQRPVEQPEDSTKPRKTRFAWEFRPVLGEKFVRGGLKQTFVQLTLPMLSAKPCFGSIRVHTYWRRFDPKTGLAMEPIEGSALFSKAFTIPNYNLAPQIDDVQYQDLGDGTLLVKVKGSFLSGTYVQLGPIRYDASKNLLVEDAGLSFVAPAAALARWTAYVVSRGGKSTRLLASAAQDYVSKPDQLSCVASDAGDKAADVPVAEMSHVKFSKDSHTVAIEMQTMPQEPDTPPQLMIVNERTNDKLQLASIDSASLDGNQPSITAQVAAPEDPCKFGSIKIAKVSTQPWGETDTELTVTFDPSSTGLDDVLLDVGHKVFGLADSPVKRDSTLHTIAAIVPTTLLVAGRGVRAFHLFWTSPDRYTEAAAQARNECFASSWTLKDFDIDAPAEKLVLISVDPKGNATYLLYGNSLSKAKILFPDHVTSSKLDNAPEDRMLLLNVQKADMATTKKLVLQMEDGRRPLVLDIPQPEPKPPKVTLDSPVIVNTNQLDVPVERVDDLVSVKMGEKKLQYTKGKDFIRFTSLRADGVTSEQSTREIVFEFNDGTKVTVKLEVVAQRVGVK